MIKVNGGKQAGLLLKVQVKLAWVLCRCAVRANIMPKVWMWIFRGMRSGCSLACLAPEKLR